MHASNSQWPQGFSETRYSQKNSNCTRINTSKAPRIAPCQEYGSPLNPRVTIDFEKKGWNHKANMHPQSDFSGSGSRSFQSQQSFYDSASNNERESSSEKDSQSFYSEDPYDSRSEATERSNQNSYGSQKSNTANQKSWNKNFARDSAKQIHKNSDWHQIAVNYFEFGTFYAHERESDSTYPDRFYSYYPETQERGEIKLCYPSRQGKEAKKIQLQFQNKRIGFGFDFCEAIYSKLEYDGSFTVYFHLNCIPLFEIRLRNTKKFSRTLNFVMPRKYDGLLKECLFRSTVIKVSFANNQFIQATNFLSRKKISNLWRKFETINSYNLEFPYLTYNNLINCGLSSRIKLALLACLTHKKINLYELTEHFMSFLEHQDSETILKTLEDILKIERKFDSLTYEPFLQLFWKLYEENATTKAQWASTEIPPNFCRVKAVTITPTVINYSLGEYALSNPVLQRYKDDQDNFIRVTFSDDMGKGIQKLPEIIEKRFKKLAGNLCVLDKKYKFLAYSQSQLRNNAVWMFADNKFLTVERILHELGDFRPIKTPAKNGARKGQLLSASLKTIELDESTNILIEDEDIETKDGKYKFSDGIDRISSDLIDFIQKQCNIDGIICAIQVRLGGVKGLLVKDPKLAPNTIVLRPSMIKFEKSSFIRTLSVLDYNKYHAAYLNKQIIVLLLANGLHRSIFPQIQEENFKGITNGCVSNLLHYVTDDTQLPVKKVVRDCISRSINLGTDPFLTGVINSIQTQAFRSTLDSKLLVKEGAILIGVLDEYNVLEPGEIFVCISPSNGKDDDIQIILGTMIVTKNPCLHPGDIRILKGVCNQEIKKKLKHLVNCIVFPAKGKRPHTNEIAGSDLDGDKYFVSWDQRLIPPREADPMCYDTQKPKEQNTIVRTDDIINFFFEYAMNDKLGTIDNALLACMDYHIGKRERLCWKCEKLAEAHSIAVDYAKSGNKPEIEVKDFTPNKFPEHMGKEGSKSENSGSVLEYLCTNLKQKSKDSELFRRYKDGFKISSEDIEIDHRLIVKGFERYLPIALSALQMYYQETTFFMSKYGIRNECEVYSCSFTKFKKNSKYHHKNAVHLAQLQEKVAIHIESIQTRVKKLIEPFLEAKYARNIEQIASAFYIAAYYNKNCQIGYIHEIMRKIGPGGELLVKLRKDNGQMIGLPWYNFSEILVKRLQKPH